MGNIFGIDLISIPILSLVVKLLVPDSTCENHRVSHAWGLGVYLASHGAECVVRGRIYVSCSDAATFRSGRNSVHHPKPVFQAPKSVVVSVESWERPTRFIPEYDRHTKIWQIVRILAGKIAFTYRGYSCARLSEQKTVGACFP